MASHWKTGTRVVSLHCVHQKEHTAPHPRMARHSPAGNCLMEIFCNQTKLICLFFHSTVGKKTVPEFFQSLTQTLHYKDLSDASPPSATKEAFGGAKSQLSCLYAILLIVLERKYMKSVGKNNCVWIWRFRNYVLLPGNIERKTGSLEVQDIIRFW